MADTAPVRPEDKLDRPALEAYLRSAVDVPDVAMAVAQFTGGSANLTYQVAFGPIRLVVRRPPRGHLAAGSHDMAREYRVLRRLNAAYPRAPLALAYCADDTVIGAPFLVVEHRDGVVIRHAIPEAIAAAPDAARRVDLAVLDAAADLHAVDPNAAGLQDLGRPDGFGRRQVDGWRRRWQSAAPDGGDGLMQDVAARLAARVPDGPRVAVVHNDLKLDNCQFQPGDPDTVTSVFDWDMATLGDPLFDLGMLLISMRTSPAWVLTDDEAVARYAARSEVEVRDIDWYLAFANWRTAVVLQQLHNRFAAGDSTDPRYARFAAAIPEYARRAAELAGRAGTA